MALIIGIDVYDSNDLKPLPSCKKDANDLYNLLRTEKFDFTIFTDGPMIGSKLKKKYGWAEIRTNINDFFYAAKPGQTLLFYFSGHGIPYGEEVFLATPSIDPKNPSNTGFAVSDLTKLMGWSKSRQIVGIIDSCHSGATDLPNTGPGKMTKKNAAKLESKNTLANFDKVWKNTPKNKGIYLLLSSQSYEASNALEKSNSLYTRYLIEGLKGIKPTVKNGKRIEYSGSINDNGQVTPESLHEYVYGKVANEAEQVPDMKVDRASSIILAEYPELAISRTASTITANMNEISRYMVKARDAYYANNYDIAIEYYDKVLEMNRRFADAYNDKGDVFYKQKKYDEALAQYNKAIEMNPKEPHFWYSTYLTLRQLKNFDEAKQYYNKAIQLDPSIKKAEQSSINYSTKFEPLPTCGYPPYHLSLDSILSANQMADIFHSRAISFHTVGDTGGITNSFFQNLVINAMINDLKSDLKIKPSFLYLLGDVVYWYGNASQYYSQFYSPYEHYTRPIFAIPGNHDGSVDPNSTQSSLSAFINNFCSKEHKPTKEAEGIQRDALTQPNVYWTLYAPFVTIIGLYSNVGEEGQFDIEQESWLTNELRIAPKEKAVILAVHHPPFSVRSYGKRPTVTQKTLDNAFKTSGRPADLVLAAHYNNYQRFTRHYENYQIPYIIAGAGGYPKLKHFPIGKQLPYSIQDEGVTLENYCDDRHGYLYLTVTPEFISGIYCTVSIRQQMPNEIDNFVLDFQRHRL